MTCRIGLFPSGPAESDAWLCCGAHSTRAGVRHQEGQEQCENKAQHNPRLLNPWIILGRVAGFPGRNLLMRLELGRRLSDAPTPRTKDVMDPGWRR